MKEITANILLILKIIHLNYHKIVRFYNNKILNKLQRIIK